MSEKPKLPETTQLRELYEALRFLQQAEEMRIAELHAEEPRRLVNRFTHSVDAAAKRPGTEEPFFETGRKDPREEVVHPSDIDSTFDFATQVVAAEQVEVADRPDLTFSYVDREIFPARTKDEATRWVKRTLDLLLVSGGRPVVGELKRGNDSLPYFALVQALMHAAELVAPPQRARLSKTFEKAGFSFGERGPWLDVYVIEFDVAHGSNREPSLELTDRIAAALMNDNQVAEQIGRIAYLKAEADGDGLAFASVFAHEGR